MNLKFWNSKIVGWIYRHIQRRVFRHDLEVERQYRYDDCVDKFRERLEKNNIPISQPAPGEDEYQHFWQQFCPIVEPYSYRFFYHIVGENPHIVPEDVASAYIESILNPENCRLLYSDKNLVSKIIRPESSMPYSYLYRVAGGRRMISEKGYHDFTISSKDLAQIIGQSVNKIILKPSNFSHSGANVMLFKRENGIYKNNSIELSGPFLQRYGKDFVIQEVIEQHPYLSQFCTTSCNTIRVMTYRSVIDESINVFGAVLRIGHEGSVVDNLFAGGGFVVIDIETGKLGHCVYNQYGQVTRSINNIDFSINDYNLPFWDQVIAFSKRIAEQVPHHRLLAQDIVVDKAGRSRLIEFNVDGFNWGFTMYAGKIPFGDKFDEVINYCLENKQS